MDIELDKQHQRHREQSCGYQGGGLGGGGGGGMEWEFGISRCKLLWSHVDEQGRIAGQGYWGRWNWQHQFRKQGLCVEKELQESEEESLWVSEY